MRPLGILVFAICLSATARGEAWVISPAPCGAAGCPMAADYLNPKGTIRVFDDKVFEFTPTDQDEPDYLEYNVRQKKRWIKQCERLKDRNYKAFKSCYFEKKKTELRALPFTKPN